MPRPGRTLAASVHRPLAEQVVLLAAPQPGERVLELADGDGELTTRLRTAVGPDGSVDVAGRPWNLTHEPAEFALAVSLLAIDSQVELQAVLPQLAVVARRAFVAVTAGGATHDNALRAAWRDVTGAEPESLPPTDPVTAPPGWRQSRLSDVARFDGIDQVTTALTEERGIAVPDGAGPALRERLAAHLARYTARDGTMRIPVHATVLSRTAGK